ncbi:hypothetical protein VNN41_07360 [Lactococcus garvieae]|uniref:hypothetical protein n=1 Tax=Lactococcus garvieae TaxID=1363 RepID=UPI00324A05C8
MSDKKYAVKCKLASHTRFIFGINKRDESYSIEIYPGSNYNNSYFKTHFTKLELSEIMDGELYKIHDVTPDFDERQHKDWIYNHDIDKYEWINPLIELVEVEE